MPSAATATPWMSLLSGTALQLSGMAAGDALRVWFPEMVECSCSHWHQGISLDVMVELRDDMDAMSQRIRSERRIRSALIKCSRCAYVGAGTDSHVSLRAMILSLGRFRIASADQTHALEKAWAAKRKDSGLDLYGRRTKSQNAEVAICAHQQSPVRHDGLETGSRFRKEVAEVARQTTLYPPKPPQKACFIEDLED